MLILKGIYHHALNFTLQKASLFQIYPSDTITRLVKEVMVYLKGFSLLKETITCLKVKVMLFLKGFYPSKYTITRKLKKVMLYLFEIFTDYNF